MPKYKVLAVATRYWKPREDYISEIIRGIEGKIVDGDMVVVSEKAISTALNNIVDESKVKPSLNAKLIARFWMRIIWGYLLGSLCHLRRKLIQQLRTYPLEMGSRHKQVALQYSSFSQSLMFGSEGGIDGSNVAYSFVSLPLTDAEEIAKKIHKLIGHKLQKKVSVIIVDTDKTFSFRNFHFTPRPKSIKGIRSFGGFATYIIGRVFRLKKRATPIAIAGSTISIETTLEIAELANRARGYGAGRTVWDMTDRFRVRLDRVSWEILETVKHKPIVIVRSKR